MKRSFFIFEQTRLYSPTELNEMGPKVETTLHAFALVTFFIKEKTPKCVAFRIIS